MPRLRLELCSGNCSHICILTVVSAAAAVACNIDCQSPSSHCSAAIWVCIGLDETRAPPSGRARTHFSFPATSPQPRRKLAGTTRVKFSHGLATAAADTCARMKGKRSSVAGERIEEWRHALEFCTSGIWGKKRMGESRKSGHGREEKGLQEDGRRERGGGTQGEERGKRDVQQPCRPLSRPSHWAPG